jgi:acetoin utilization deacetylase AcuC-like enzyme
MNKTVFLYDRMYLLHDTGPYHPECPERLMQIYKGIENGGLMPDLIRIEGEPAEMKWIRSVHETSYIRRFEETCLAGNSSMDSPDNQMSRETYETAILAVGGVLKAVSLVMEGEGDNAFCAVRPPGHHAEVSEALGFCYFNNIAIAARYVQAQWNIKKVGIIDFDVHHGNGTQHIFAKDPTVFYYSIHEHPSFAFPGTGRDFEKGSGPGEGFTLNTPVLPGKGDDEYYKLIEKDMMQAIAGFKPEILLVSTGFDAHEDDDMSGIRLSTEAFSWIMKKIMQLADTHCQGKLISVLEGGYCLERLPELAKNHVEILLGK